jgi:thioesterase domain-containing protein/aryl carrier-like protein
MTKLKNVQDIYPLAPIQELMLLYSLSLPGTGVLCEQSSFTLQGKLDKTALIQAWQHVIQHHPILRTAFLWEGLKQPLQVVRQQVDLPWEEYDFRHFSAGEMERQLRQYRLQVQQRGFDLTKAPLLRLTIVYLADEIYEMIWTYHHIILDGWSLPLVLQDVFASYTAFHQGHAPHLPASPAYRHYITWLQQQSGGVEQFWHQQLQGMGEPTPLQFDAGRPDEDQTEATFAEYTSHLDEKTTAALQEIARRYHVTVNILLQGAWALLLSRYSQRKDILFGITVAGRPASLPQVERMVGPFINNLPLRIQVQPEMMLSEWIQQLHSHQVAIQEYAYVSPLSIQRWSEFPSQKRLYESLFIFENYPVVTAEKGNEEVHDEVAIVDVRAGVRTGYPLTLVAMPGHVLTISLSYDRRRFRSEVIEKVLEQYVQVLTAIVEHTEKPLAFHLNVLTLEETALPDDLQVSSDGTLIAPRDYFELQLAGIWEELLAHRAVSIHDNFFELGGHSLLVMSLLERVQQQCGLRVSVSDLFQRPTIAGMADCLRSQSATAPWTPLVAIKPQGRKTPFFCVHPGPGSVFCYLHLAHRLDLEQPFYALQACGLDGREEPSTSIEEMAASYIAAMRTVQPEGPYLLGGHCFGGIVALEMAQQLAEDGQQVALLAIMDTPPPIFQEPEDNISAEEMQLARVAGMAEALERFLGIKLHISYDDLLHRSQDEQHSILMERLQQLNFMPPGAGGEQIQALLRVSQANDIASAHYQPQMAPCAITLFRAQDLPAELGDGILADLYRDPAFGWRAFSPSLVELYHIPGDHVTMLTEPHVRVLAASLQRTFASAQLASHDREES